HKQAGKLTLGHGSTATDGIAEKDLSGTKLAGYSKIALSGGGFEFWDQANDQYNFGTDEDPKYITVGDVFNQLDGGRKNMIRYDSPELAGLSLAAASAADNFADITLTYRKKLEPLEFRAGIGYAYEGADDPEEQNLRNRMSGSASVLFNFGLNFTVAAGNAEFDDDPTTTADRDDASFSYVKVGYIFEPFSLGSTAVSVDYGMFDDFAAKGDEGTVYGLQIVQKADPINTEFYLGFRNMELDRDSVTYANVDLDDIQTTMAGARFKF
ncbi:MAG: porin, partial [Desulfurivibrionaceae bacterium]|nr:porin [Desulfurivibrionaceae bacterium]